MHITAHPDDEDGGLIALLSRGWTLPVLSRGEAGANLITGDFFDSLGALRPPRCCAPPIITRYESALPASPAGAVRWMANLLSLGPLMLLGGSRQGGKPAGGPAAAQGSRSTCVLDWR